MKINIHSTSLKYRWVSTTAFLLLAVVAGVSSVPAVRAADPGQLAQVLNSQSFASGMAAMRGRKYADARSHFEAATKASPRDSRPWMMLGMALNRLGDFPAALAALDKSKSLGMTAPRLDFEIGWAALNTGSPQRAVDRLLAYENAKPGEAKTSEFLGRAYLSLGKLDEAEKSLGEALRRDPGLLPTVQLYRARIALARGDNATAARDFLSIARDAPDSPIGQSIRDNVLRPLALERLRRRQQDRKPWSAYASSTVGNNDNVIGYSSELTLPAEITRRDSSFLSFEAGGQYVHRIGEDHALTGGYDGRFDNFLEIGNVDVFDNNLFARYEYAVRQVPGNVVAAVQGSYGHARVGGSRFRDSLGIRPSVSFYPADNFRMEAFYGRTMSVIHSPSTGNPAVTDRDATLTSAGMRATVAVPDTTLTVSAGVARLHNNADGTDHGYQGNQFSVGARMTLFDDYTVTGEFAKTDFNYTSPHSLAPNPANGAGFFFARRDDITTVNLQVSRPVADGVDVFAKFDYTRAHSNLLLFTYNQNVFGVGVVARF